MLMEGNVEVLDLATCTRIVCALELLSPLAALPCSQHALRLWSALCMGQLWTRVRMLYPELVFVPPMKPTLRRNHEKSV